MEPNAAARLAKAFFTWFSPFCFNCWSVSSCFHSFWQSLVRDLCITALQQLQVRISTSASSMSLSSHDFATCVALFFNSAPIMPQWLWSACQSSSYCSCTAQFQKTVFINANYIQLKFCTLAHNQGTNMLLYTQDAYRCTRLHRGMYVFVCTDACTCMYAYMICTHTCAYMRVYARICTKTCTHMQTCMRAYEHVHARIRYSHILYARACTHKHTARASIHTRAHTIFTYVYILIHAYMHTYYTYMHTYIHTNIQQQHTHTLKHSFINTCIHAYMHTYNHAYIHT